MCEILKEGLSSLMCPQRSQDKKDWCDECRIGGFEYDNFPI